MSIPEVNCKTSFQLQSDVPMSVKDDIKNYESLPYAAAITFLRQLDPALAAGKFPTRLHFNWVNNFNMWDTRNPDVVYPYRNRVTPRKAAAIMELFANCGPTCLPQNLKA